MRYKRTRDMRRDGDLPRTEMRDFTYGVRRSGRLTHLGPTSDTLLDAS